MSHFHCADSSNGTDTPTDSSTDASDDPEGDGMGGNEGGIGGVPVLTIVIAGGSVGLVAVFLVVLLLMMCCACFWKARPKKGMQF